MFCVGQDFYRLQCGRKLRQVLALWWEGSDSWQFAYLGSTHITMLPQTDCILNRLDLCHYMMEGEGDFIDENGVEWHILWLGSSGTEAEAENVAIWHGL